MNERIGKTNIVFGWVWLFIAIIGAMLLGLFAFKSGWCGAYDSLPRRFIRLAHISFIALSLTNVLYGICVDSTSLPAKFKKIGSYSMIIAAVCMPLICLLSAWHNVFQIFFFIPAGTFACAVLIMAIGQIKAGPV